jgi:hypothetical protein
VLRRKSGPKRKKTVVGDWRKLHNEELHKLYSSPNIRSIRSQRVTWVKQVASMEEMGNVYKILS